MGRLTHAELKGHILAGTVDTVMLAFPDQYGQLLGKRLTAGYYLERMPVTCCSYLLTIDIEEVPLPGFAAAGWAAGYGDLHLLPDPATIRLLPWEPGTALIICDLVDGRGELVPQAPRTMLRRQAERYAARGMEAYAASELEFFLFSSSFDAVLETGYSGIRPASPFPIDYHLTRTAADEVLLGEICRKMELAAIPVESRKGETGRGQYEIGLRYAGALEMADRHVVYKHGVKVMAAAAGRAVTFMAKFSDRDAGSSCHIHTSVTGSDSGRSLFAAEADGTETAEETGAGLRLGEPGTAGEAAAPFFQAYLAGLMHYAPEFFLLYAPTVNSYRRFVDNSFAPTGVAWDWDNRTAAFRIVGHGQSLRIENRFPGADVNPYHAIAAMLAAGLSGADSGMELPSRLRGNLYADSGIGKVPRSLEAAADRFDCSDAARRCFGDAMVDHLVRHARLEAELHSRQVSEWELKRYFERI